MKLPILPRAYTVGPKGQLTLPAKLRKAFNIKPGTKLEVFPRADGNFEIRVVRPSRILDYAGDLQPRTPNRKSKL